jgi:hypothetical protein
MARIKIKKKSKVRISHSDLLNQYVCEEIELERLETGFIPHPELEDKSYRSVLTLRSKILRRMRHSK